MRHRKLVTMATAALFAGAIALSGLIGCSGAKQESAGTSETPSTETGATTGGETPAGGETAAAGGAIAHGKQLFEQNCQTCHGPTGMGDGPLGASLNPKPRNFHDAGYMDSRPDDSLFVSIKMGKSQMPAWGAQGMSDQDIRDVIAYVRTLK